ncbi:hypothetical protein OAP06_04645 [Gammaproteobacteria bacterium]|nr:hypothetical protein [Gammaproteobacteria bacterium]
MPRMIEKNCLNCNKKLKVDVSTNRGKKQSYCSMICLREGKQSQYRSEAKRVGMTHLGKGSISINHQLYRFNKCGHKQEINPHHIRVNKGFRCNSCIEENHIKEATEAGLSIVENIQDSSYKIYRFNKCGHTQKMQPTNIRNSKPKCQKCFAAEINEEAEVAGVKLVGEGSNKNNKLYMFKQCGHTQELSLYNIRHLKIHCNECKLNELRKEAKNVGLELISKVRTERYLYKIKSCGCEKIISPHNVRKNNFRCKPCLLLRLENEAEEVGLILLGAGRNGAFRTYRFKICGHEKSIATSSVRNDEFRCEICYEAILKKDAKAIGLELLGKGKNAFYRYYQFKICGHKKEMQYMHVRQKVAECKICLQARWEKEAKEVGLKLIGSSSRGSGYKIYEFIKCKHQQVISLQAVKNNSFICRQCEETAYDLPSKVYLLKLKHKDLTWLKLGHAKNVSTRIKSYGLVDGVKVDTLIAIDFDTGRQAEKYEYIIGKEHEKYKYGQKKMKEYMTHSGFTECFKTKAQDLLMSRIMQSEIDLRSTS